MVSAEAEPWRAPPATLWVQASHPRPLPRRAQQALHCRVRFHLARSYAGETPALPGGSRPRRFRCRQPFVHGQSLARDAELAFAGFVSIVPGRMRAGRPRSRVGPARDAFAAGNLSSTANPLQGRRACLCRVRFHLARSYAGETPALPGGGRPRRFRCRQPFVHGQSLARGAEFAFEGFVPIVPGPMRAGRPRSRGGLHPLDVIAAREVHRSLYPFVVRPCRRTLQNQLLQIPCVHANYPCKPQGVGASHCDSTFYRWPGFALNWVPAVCDSAP